MPFNYAYQKYLKAISQFSLLKKGDSVLVGFSGGADSTLLLTLLSMTEGISVAAAHLNHGIRGTEADRDEAFCKSYCEKLGIKLFTSYADIPSISKATSKSLEEAARDARYSFFNEVAENNGFSLIATAHNADDALETAIFHLARGTSLDGLCGIPPKRDNIVRPLILLSKEEIVSALNSSGIPFVIDSTNNDTEYTRNKIRHSVVPILKELNPSVIDCFNGTAELLRRDRECLESLSQKYSLKNGRAVLSSLHDSVLSRVLVRELHLLGSKPERKHVDMLVNAIRSKESHISLSLPALTAVCDRDTVYFEQGAICPVPFSIPLKSGINELPDGRVIYVGNSEKDIISLKNIYKLSIHATLRSDKIGSDSVIRSRREADTIRQGGMTKRVKKLLQSLKLPSSYTRGIPFIETKGSIVYIPHFAPSDYAVAKSGDAITHIYYFYNS